MSALARPRRSSSTPPASPSAASSSRHTAPPSLLHTHTHTTTPHRSTRLSGARLAQVVIKFLSFNKPTIDLTNELADKTVLLWEGEDEGGGEEGELHGDKPLDSLPVKLGPGVVLEVRRKAQPLPLLLIRTTRPPYLRAHVCVGGLQPLNHRAAPLICLLITALRL